MAHSVKADAHCSALGVPSRYYKTFKEVRVVTRCRACGRPTTPAHGMGIFLQALAREGRDQPSQQLDLETAWANGFMPGLSEEEEGLLPPGSEERLYTEVASLPHKECALLMHLLAVHCLT